MDEYPGKQNAIRFLVSRKFPAYYGVTAASNVGQVLSQDERQTRERLAARGRDYIAELESMSEKDRRALWATEWFAFCQQEDLKASRKREDVERGRLYNTPDSAADYAYWARMPFWSIEEGIALCMGKNPNYAKLEHLAPIAHESVFAQEFMEAYELAKRSASNGQLYEPSGPGHFIAWADAMGATVPETLRKAVSERHPTRDLQTELQSAHQRIAELEKAVERDKELDPRERTTLLNIIGVLAEKERLDLRQPTKAADVIERMFEAKGITIKSRAIARHLGAVLDAMDARKG